MVPMIQMSGGKVQLEHKEDRLFDVAVIGGAGNMGRLFASYFSSRGFSVIISDVAFPKLRPRMPWTNNNVEAASKSRLVIISVPPDKTTSVIREVVPFLRSNSVVAEITSVKRTIVAELRTQTHSDVTFLSLHPLFGPNQSNDKKWKFGLVPVMNTISELSTAEVCFPGTKFIAFDIEAHDKAMAMVLSIARNYSKYFNPQNADNTLLRSQLNLTKTILRYDPSLSIGLMQGVYYFPFFLKLVAPDFTEHVKTVIHALLSLRNKRTRHRAELRGPNRPGVP